MRTLTGLVLALAIMAPPLMAAPPVASHPILGIWKLTLPDSRCAEVYRFRVRRLEITDPFAALRPPG